MQFVCRQQGELLLLDPVTNEMHTLPEERTRLDVAKFELGSEVRVAFSDGQPVWLVDGPESKQREVLNVGNLPQYLERYRKHDLVVEFDDGDRYAVSALDLQGENPDGEFEIVVSFADCLGPSEAEARALEAGSLNRSAPGTAWTSETPSRPVGMRYTPDQIRAVYDNLAGEHVYERV